MNVEYLRTVNQENYKSQLISKCAIRCDIKNEDSAFVLCIQECLNHTFNAHNVKKT